MAKISIKDVKGALKDSRFRNSLPKEMSGDIDNFLNNPGCPCHLPLYRRILKECTDQLLKYFPGMEPPDLQDDVRQLAENHWRVINCHVDELESKLTGLGPGRKQLDVARWQDQVTVVVNELDASF